MTLPKISVIMTTFNHELYIEKAVDSVLNQTYKEWELIIVDDGSKDATLNKLRNYSSDKRIKVISKENEGTSIAFNVGFSLAQGEWIAVMSGDDICLSSRLEEQLKYAESFGIKAVFALPEIIDSQDQLALDSLQPVFFTKHDETQEGLFKELFYKGNFLCAPTAFLHKSILGKQLFQPTLLQLQDYALWLDLSYRYKMAIMHTRLIKYRRHENSLSLKGAHIARAYFEWKSICGKVLNNMDWQQLHSFFPESISFAAKYDNNIFEIEKALIMLKHPVTRLRELGLRRIQPFLDDDNLREKCIEVYGISMKKFFEEADKIV
jgi:glycosyltransferase involved in cell wall biosynthesis